MRKKISHDLVINAAYRVSKARAALLKVDVVLAQATAALAAAQKQRPRLVTELEEANLALWDASTNHVGWRR